MKTESAPALPNLGTFMNRPSHPRLAGERVADSQTFDEEAAKNEPNTTLVLSCGSRWAGEEEGTLVELFALLEATALDPRFEDYGDFAQYRPESCRTGEPLVPEGWWHFNGNFLTVSHGFSIYTNSPEIIERFQQAIAANKQMPEYQAEKNRDKSNDWFRKPAAATEGGAK